MRHRPIILAAAGLFAGCIGLAGANAAGVTTSSGANLAVTQTQDANIQPASHRKRWKRWHSNRWHHGPRFRHGHYRHRHRGWYGNPFWAGIAIAPLYRPYRAYGGGSAHVRWCYNRYRSYDVRSDTFMGYDGYRHPCNSPYRY